VEPPPIYKIRRRPALDKFVPIRTPPAGQTAAGRCRNGGGLL